jgi:hypothetical protein
MTKFSDLVGYFKDIAVKHKSIGHSDLEKHFFRFEINEVLAGLNRTDVNYPMLILEGYNFDYTDNKSDNLLKNRNGAFVLLSHINDPTDYQDIHEKWDALESIGDDILNKIKSDKSNPLTPVVRSFDFQNVEANLIMNEVGSTVGIRYTFVLTGSVNTQTDSTKWLQ